MIMIMIALTAILSWHTHQAADPVQGCDLIGSGWHVTGVSGPSQTLRPSSSPGARHAGWQAFAHPV
jgi:hypothetical protein